MKVVAAQLARDIQHFADFTGDRFYAHTDEEAAARNPFFDGRVAHGYLIVSFAAGLFAEWGDDVTSYTFLGRFYWGQ